MEVNDQYPKIFLNDNFEETVRKSSVRFFQTNKPASFDDSSAVVNVKVNGDKPLNMYLTTPVNYNRRYSDTSITKYCDPGESKQIEGLEMRSRKRYIPRQLSIQKPPALEEISIDILKANCSFGGNIFYVYIKIYYHI